MKTLTEAQAWTRIARDIEKGKWRGTGLCSEAGRLYEENRVDIEVWRMMARRIDRHAEATFGFNGGYVWDRGDSEPRILAANFLALEAADEARAAR